MTKPDINSTLPLVQRPARYIDSEWNSVKKGNRTGTSVCFCFPDLYEIGASNLGLEILYHIVNKRDDAYAERCYTPAVDMETELRGNNIPLFSLETHTPLKNFDIVGITLQYELCATNVVNLLDMAGLPLMSAERNETFPLVIGGGPVTANPEPLADFFDAFVIGDGEEVIGEIIELISNLKSQISNPNKKELLIRLSKIPGVYVPSLYRLEYKTDGTISSIKPDADGVPETVIKRTVKLEDVYFPSEQIVPYLQTVHNRLNIEIARGCAHHCRFCQASRYYWPWRVRSKEKILELVEKGLAQTGYEEVALSSLSCTDYRGLDTLLDEINYKHASKRINISIPSMRCDQFSLKVADNLSHNKRSSLTFAPEAATDRLRNVIGKDLTGDQIRTTLALAFKMGWRLIKLYFMVGLPTETDEDIDGVSKLLREVRLNAPRINFNVTVSPFVPKAQTPFQWMPMTNADTLKKRMAHLSKTLPASVKSHHLDGSILEAIFARGDRRLSKAIVLAWQKGCRFDQWKEHLKFDIWTKAFAESGIDTGFYLNRERGSDEVLPWEHLIFGAKKEDLLKEYQSALSLQNLEVEPVKAEQISAPVDERTPAKPATYFAGISKPAQKLRLRFARAGVVRFLSHLEQIEVFRRSLRRAGLPLVYSSGFHPQPKIAFGPAVSVGYESMCEYIEVELSQRVETQDVEERLRNSLPGGFTLVGLKRMPLFFPALDSLVNLAAYEIAQKVSEDRIAEFLSQNEIIIEKHKEGRVDKIDAKPLIRELKVVEGKILLQLRFGPKKNIKPERIIEKLCCVDERSSKLLRITRADLFIEKKDGSISEP